MTSEETEEEMCVVNDNIVNFLDLDEKIDDVNNILNTKKEYKLNYENELELNKDLYHTRLGMLNNIIEINGYNKKLIMSLIAIIFGVIITITSVVVLNNRK
jgi:hypothetical protein